jgi:hypothetical protein
MKKIFTIIMLCGVVGSYAQNTPPNAANTIIWVIGEQSWSAAIRMPECNKDTFDDSYTDPQCRSYTEEGKTWYYYNWAYVNANKERMCPSPWRVPTIADMETLESNSNENALIDAWGYGGSAGGGSVSVNSDENAVYWSSEGGTVFATLLIYNNDALFVYVDYKSHGVQVRCVK